MNQHIMAVKHAEQLKREAEKREASTPFGSSARWFAAEAVDAAAAAYGKAMLAYSDLVILRAMQRIPPYHMPYSATCHKESAHA